MKLPDTNLWLALTLSRHTHHASARQWLELQTTPDSICFCRSTQQSLVRLLTTAAVLKPYGIDPLENRKAWETYEAFVADDRIIFRDEPPGLEAIWKKLGSRRTTSAKLWMDAYLAAFAMGAGAQLVTTDTAFIQFSGLDAAILKAT